MPGETDLFDRAAFIAEARAVAAMDIWIRNGGPPAAVERGGIDREIDQLVGFTSRGEPLPGFERGTVAEHYQTVTLQEWTLYPEHEPRKPTAAYNRIHKKLINDEDSPCLVCGVRKSTLQTPAANPFGANQMETHHRTIEWALIQAIDLQRFNERVVARLRLRTPPNPAYASDLTQQQMNDWIDHSPDNLWVLCSIHHRAPYMGIHAITQPHWGAQDLVFPKFWNRAPDKAAGGDKPQPGKRPSAAAAGPDDGGER